MYNYIKGNVTLITSKQITIETHGIGYSINVSNPLLYTLNENVLIYTHMYIKEDEVSLYGFKTTEERDVFLKLLSCRGIGPKTAILILSKGTLNDLKNAIKKQNNSYLESFPGIGPKSSTEIIRTLSAKFFKESEQTKVHDIKEALKNLGFKDKEINKINDYLFSNLDKSLEVLLKECLTQIKETK